MTPVLYLDLDGTVRKGKDELGRFVNGPQDVEMFDGVPELLEAYKNLGWRIIGCSNQGGVGLGYMSMATCQAAVGATQRLSGNAFDKIVVCPHRPDSDCECRKPKPGMVLTAQQWLTEEFGDEFPLDQSLFVGDRPEDQACAHAAGVPFLLAEIWRTGSHLEDLIALAE
jgi:D-glycero-D-manno-heptose 1,7-bisphosphate phosphatase